MVGVGENVDCTEGEEVVEISIERSSFHDRFDDSCWWPICPSATTKSAAVVNLVPIAHALARF